MVLPVSRERTYAQMQKVRSADLNAIQDAIINGLGAHGLYDANGYPTPDGNALPSWIRSTSSGVWETYSAASAASLPLYFTFMPRVGAILTNVDVKFSANDSGELWSFTLRKIDMDFGSPTTAPGDTLLDSEIGLNPTAAGWTTLSNETSALNAGPLTMAADEYVLLAVSTDTIASGNKVQGVHWNWAQLSP